MLPFLGSGVKLVGFGSRISLFGNKNKWNCIKSHTGSFQGCLQEWTSSLKMDNFSTVVPACRFYLMISHLMSTCLCRDYKSMNQSAQLKSRCCNSLYRKELGKSRQIIKNLEKFSLLLLVHLICWVLSFHFSCSTLRRFWLLSIQDLVMCRGERVTCRRSVDLLLSWWLRFDSVSATDTLCVTDEALKFEFKCLLFNHVTHCSRGSNRCVLVISIGISHKLVT